MKKRWGVMSVLVGAGIGAAAVSMMRNQGKTEIEKMTRDYLQASKEDPVFR